MAISAARNRVNDYLNFQWAPRHPRDERFPNIRGVLFPAGEVDVSLVLIPVTYHCHKCPFEQLHIRCVKFLSFQVSCEWAFYPGVIKQDFSYRWILSLHQKHEYSNFASHWNHFLKITNLVPKKKPKKKTKTKKTKQTKNTIQIF